MRWGEWLPRDGKPDHSEVLDLILRRDLTWGVLTPLQQNKHCFTDEASLVGAQVLNRVQRGRCVTCGELGGERVHFLVHHLLVQSPQAKRLHCERQGSSQHGIHVHTSEKRDTKHETRIRPPEGKTKGAQACDASILSPLGSPQEAFSLEPSAPHWSGRSERHGLKHTCEGWDKGLWGEEESKERQELPI